MGPEDPQCLSVMQLFAVLPRDHMGGRVVRLLKHPLCHLSGEKHTLTGMCLLFCRYVTGHIWACPPSEGDDYIFHCHPPDQKIPKPKRLQEWYKKMLDKAFAERIIHDYKVRGT